MTWTTIQPNAKHRGEKKPLNWKVQYFARCVWKIDQFWQFQKSTVNEHTQFTSVMFWLGLKSKWRLDGSFYRTKTKLWQSVTAQLTWTEWGSYLLVSFETAFNEMCTTVRHANSRFCEGSFCCKLHLARILTFRILLTSSPDQRN